MRGIEQFLQVDAATLGALKYAGTWNASTNTPTLASGVGVQGQYYVVSVAGSTNLDGETAWQVGDWAVFNGTVWQKVDGGSTGLLSTLTVTGSAFLSTTSGDVGIGTTSPAQKLDVVGNLALSNPTTAGTAALVGRAAGNNTWLVGPDNSINGGTDQGLSLYSYGATNLRFYTNAAERMRITSAGDVGIGTGTPSGKFGVNNPGTGQVGFNGGTVSSPNRGNLFYDTDGTGWDFRIGKLQAGVFTPQLTIKDSGNVGIGNTSPSVGLDVSNGFVWIGTQVAATGLGGNIRFRDDTGTPRWLNGILGSAGATAYSIYDIVAAADRLNITSAGDVGIGTSSPAYKLDVVGSINASSSVLINTTNGVLFGDSGNSLVIAADNGNTGANTRLQFNVDGSERMRLDSAGNLGLGVTPAAHNPSGFGGPMLQVGNRASLMGSSVYSTLGNNVYYDSGFFRYIATDEASMLEQENGAFKWFTAPSGTAGNAISFTQAMTLDASGDFIVGGTTTNGVRLTAEKSNPTRGIIAHVVNSGSSGLTGSQLMFTQNTVNNWAVGQPAGVDAFAFWSGRNTAADGTERMRIDSSGNFLVGTSISPSGSGVRTVTASTSSVYSQWTRTVGVIGGGAIGTSGQNIEFFTHTGTVGSETYTERMRIDSSGNVGVGTSSPTYKVDIQVSSGSDQNILLAGATGASNGFHVRWISATSKTHVIISDIPTSSSGLAAGTLWNDGGTIKIA